jgi:hypothetical protein
LLKGLGLTVLAAVLAGGRNVLGRDSPINLHTRAGRGGRSRANRRRFMAKERGSDLLRKLHGNFPTTHVEGLFRAVDDLGDLKILRWFPRGVPPATLVVEGVFEVPTGSVGKFVDTLIQNNEQFAANLQVFPYGVPRPDIAIVEYQGEARQ